MIKVKTSRFGEIEVDEKDVITMPAGIIGFPELKKYVIMDHALADDQKESPFKWLQSLDDGAIAFVLINPLLFKPDYVVEVPEAEVSDLTLESEENAVISVIVTMPSNPQNMTANLKAPLIFNLKNRHGKQIILSNSAYTTRHNIMEEVKKRTQEAATTQAQEAIQTAASSVEKQSQTAQVANAGKGKKK